MPDSVALLSNKSEAVTVNVTNNQVAFIRHQTGLTPITAFSSAQISGLKRDYKDQVYEAVKKAILLTLLQFNVKDSMNGLQIELLTGEIINRYYYLKIDEIFYVLKEGVVGKWKRPYNHIDGPTIHGWIAEYETTERPALLERVTAEQTRLQQEPVTMPGVSDKVKLMALYGTAAKDATEDEVNQAREIWNATQAKEQQRKAELTSKAEKLKQRIEINKNRYKTPEFLEKLRRETPEAKNADLKAWIIFFKNQDAKDAAKICEDELIKRG